MNGISKPVNLAFVVILTICIFVLFGAGLRGKEDTIEPITTNYYNLTYGAKHVNRLWICNSKT